MKILKINLFRSVMAGFYAQILQLIIQVAMVPIMISHWGVAAFGAWSILFAVPQILSMSDLGFTSSGTNTIITLVSQGKFIEARAIYNNLRWTSALFLSFISVPLIYYLLFYNSASVHFLDVYTNGKSQLLIVEITIFTAVSMQNLVTQSIFYASGKYALWEFFYNTTFLIEGFAAAVVIIDGGGFESAVEAYVVTRIISASSLLVFSRKIAPWTVDGDLFPSFAEIKRLSIPAFAAILQPASNAITLQGAIIGIGSATNPEMVPYFSTIRTISRTTLQFAYRFSYASMPKFTIAYASNQKRQKASLIILNLVFSTCFIVPTFPLLYVFGQKIIYIWTRGHVIPSKRLLLIMLTSMALNSIWVPMANILSSINQHWRFTYFFFIVSISSIAIGTFFTRYYGINAMGYALVGEEFVMVIWTSFCLRYSDAFDGAEIWRIIRSGVLQKSFYLSK